jgi:iron-sulfur cluster repair protein YtfE (RIC family)
VSEVGPALEPGFRSFSDLLRLHRKLDQLFLDHQRALLRLDLKSALAALELFETELLLHMQDEEELLIPLYGERADLPLGGTVAIFLGEHEKMRQYLVLFKEEMAKLTAEKDLERGVLWLLDSQHLFKRLLVHHDSREKKMLYPLLDQVTTDEERETLFAMMKSQPTH